MNNKQQHQQLDQKFINKIAFLDSKQRETLIPPESLISQMPIENDHTLLDVGAGSGFFTIPMAESTTGKVYALDPDKRMLSVIEAKAKDKGLNNIELIQNFLEGLSLQNDSIDFAISRPLTIALEYIVFKTRGLTFSLLAHQPYIACPIA